MANENELSERELDILRLVATGASNKEIAFKLHISPNTVKVHLRNIFAKIGAVSRTEATLHAMRLGLVEQLPARAAEDETPALVPAAEPTPAGWLVRRGGWLLAAGALAVILLTVAILLLTGGNQAVSAVPTPPPSNIIRWASGVPLPAPLEGMAATSYEETIYIIGGKNVGQTSAGVFRLVGSAWQPLAEKPTPVSMAQAVVLAERIYVPGGMQADGSPADALEVYNPRLDSWERKASLPAPRAGYALAEAEGRLYLFGGWDGTQFTTDVFAYDPVEDRWSQRSAMPQPAGYASAVEIGGRVYIVGGFDGKSALTSVQIYYPGRDLAGEPAWESGAPLPVGRYAMGAAVQADDIYLIGGITTAEGLPLPPLTYQTEGDYWTAFDAPPAAVGANLAFVRRGNFIHVLGGTSDSGAADSHLIYQALYTINVPVIQKP